MTFQDRCALVLHTRAVDRISRPGGVGARLTPCAPCGASLRAIDVKGRGAGMDAVVAELARSCVLMSRARALAAWVGPGRPVSARGVLRRGDVGAACVACGLDDPGRVRSAADVPALHRAWVVAEGAGLITVGLSEAVAATPPDDPLAQWRAGLGALLRTESADEHRIGAAVVCRVVLGVLDAPPPEDLHSFAGAVEQALDRLPDRERSAGYRAFGRVTLGETVAAELLVEGGAVVHPTLGAAPPRRVHRLPLRPR